MPDFRPAAIKPNVSRADLEKLDIRIGTIRSVEDVAASNKLVRLRVDFGDHARTILAGMKACSWPRTWPTCMPTRATNCGSSPPAGRSAPASWTSPRAVGPA